jgi:hypothetical protein
MFWGCLLDGYRVYFFTTLELNSLTPTIKQLFKFDLRSGCRAAADWPNTSCLASVVDLLHVRVISCIILWRLWRLTIAQVTDSFRQGADNLRSILDR